MEERSIRDSRIKKSYNRLKKQSVNYRLRRGKTKSTIRKGACFSSVTSYTGNRIFVRVDINITNCPLTFAGMKEYISDLNESEIFYKIRLSKSTRKYHAFVADNHSYKMLATLTAIRYCFEGQNHITEIVKKYFKVKDRFPEFSLLDKLCAAAQFVYFKKEYGHYNNEHSLFLNNFVANKVTGKDTDNMETGYGSIHDLFSKACKDNDSYEKMNNCANEGGIIKFCKLYKKLMSK